MVVAVVALHLLLLHRRRRRRRRRLLLLVGESRTKTTSVSLPNPPVFVFSSPRAISGWALHRYKALALFTLIAYSISLSLSVSVRVFVER